MVAARPEVDVDGLVLLGYPLHPPGKPAQLRTAHLPRVRAPMLFVQGSRDAFGTREEMEPVAAGLSRGTRLFVVEGGDHSLAVPKSTGVTLADTMARVADEIVAVHLTMTMWACVRALCTYAVSATRARSTTYHCSSALAHGLEGLAAVGVTPRAVHLAQLLLVGVEHGSDRSVHVPRGEPRTPQDGVHLRRVHLLG